METFKMVVPGLMEVDVPWDGEYTPDVIIDDITSDLFVKISKELSEGDRYVYRRASVIHLEISR